MSSNNITNATTNATTLDGLQEGSATVPVTADITFIDYPTLLQVDITAIVGTFIFLTIAGVARNPLQGRAWFFLTSFLVIPFAISGAAILVEDIWDSSPEVKALKEYADIPRVFALAGFLYILIVFIGIMRLLSKTAKTKTS